MSDATVADAKLASVSAALASAELDLSFTHVTAPIAGRVSRAVVTVGNLVEPQTVLTTLVSVSPVYAYFDIDEQTYLKHVNAGGSSDVNVGLIDEDGYPHRAKLDFVDNRVDANHGTIRARAVLDNADGRLTPGLFARIRLVSPQQFTRGVRRRPGGRQRSRTQVRVRRRRRQRGSLPRRSRRDARSTVCAS